MFVVLLALAVLAATAATQTRGSVLKQLQTPALQVHQSAGPGPVAASLTTASCRAQLGITPNRASVRDRVVLTLLENGHPLSGARVTVAYSMPSMNMPNVFVGSLPQTADGRYGAIEPEFGMPGTWQLRFQVAPPHSAPCTLAINDRMAR